MLLCEVLCEKSCLGEPDATVVAATFLLHKIGNLGQGLRDGGLKQSTILSKRSGLRLQITQVSWLLNSLVKDRTALAIVVRHESRPGCEPMSTHATRRHASHTVL